MHVLYASSNVELCPLSSLVACHKLEIKKTVQHKKHIKFTTAQIVRERYSTFMITEVKLEVGRDCLQRTR